VLHESAKILREQREKEKKLAHRASGEKEITFFNTNIEIVKPNC
jgi:hypothetical protein